MSLTLSIDEHIAAQARATAAPVGKSLNQAVRNDLEPLAGAQQLAAELQGWKFDRDVAQHGCVACWTRTCWSMQTSQTSPPNSAAPSR